MEEDGLYKKIVDILAVTNVCKRCTLRYFGNTVYQNYTLKSHVDKAIQSTLKINLSSEEDTSETLFDSLLPSSKRFLASPCAVCLGILQEGCDEMPLKIATAVKDSNHHFKDFVLQVSLPVVMDLRDKLFYYHLKKNLRESYKLEESSIPSVKDICKWVIGSQFGKLTETDFTPSSEFQIQISSSYSETENECFPLYKKLPDAFTNAKKYECEAKNIYSRAAVLKAMTSLSSKINELYEFPPILPEKPCFFSEIILNHSPLYLGGRYNKYSRELSQTPWVFEGERKMESSVNELITDIVKKYIICDKIIFSASGREDVDVKMLGNGRPFVLEIFNPRRTDWSFDEMKNIENDINTCTNAIAVQGLQVISKNDLLLLKEGEELKRKTYSALCNVEKRLSMTDVTLLNAIKDLTIMQKTPIRVLHRRTLSTRKKMIHSIQAEIIDDHHLQLKFETQAGTYVKEFVHSDFGRTNPNLGSLLETKADILELDVTNIDLDWPPKNS